MAPRIFFQTPDVFPQAGVLLAFLRERGGDRFVLAPGAHGVDKPLVADQRVHDQDDRHEPQDVIEQTGA